MNIINKIAGATLLLFAIASCDLNKNTKEAESQNISISVTGIQGNIKVLTSGKGQIFGTLSSGSDWKIKIEDKSGAPVSWIKVDKLSGSKIEKYNYIISYEENKDLERTAFLIASNVAKSDTVVIVQIGVMPNNGNNTGGNDNSGNNNGGDNGNGNTGGNNGGENNNGNTPISPIVPSKENVKGDVTLLETPKLAGGSNNWYATFYINGKPNYSVEWDSNWKIPRWVCFSFDDETKVKRVSRSPAWGWDGIIEPANGIGQSDFSGYDRGHMVASNDRTYSKAACEQTFYYVNMTPQLSGLNQRFWGTMEQWVQDKARSQFLGNNDVMYVVKGVAFNGGKPSKWTNSKLAVPDYYYMALVVRKGGQYHGMGMWVEHKPIGSNERRVADVAMTIDEIERRAGVDLFHNLPDDIEEMVEKENPRSGFWGL